MLEATKSGPFARRYDITVDGRSVASWSQTLWRSGGDIVLAGDTYRVDAARFSNRFTMTDQFGRVVATAERVGRRQWTMVADGRTHQFRRASIWSYRQDLMLGDNSVGFIRRTGIWNARIEADLPTLSHPAQVFLVGVMVTTWDREASTAG